MMNSEFVKWRKKICGIGQTKQRLQEESPREDDPALLAVDSTLAGSSCLFGSNGHQEEPPREDDPALLAVNSTLAGSSCLFGSNGHQEEPPREDDLALLAVDSTLAGSSCPTTISENKRRPPKMRVCYSCQENLSADDFVSSQWRTGGKCITCVRSILRGKGKDDTATKNHVLVVDHEMSTGLIDGEIHIAPGKKAKERAVRARLHYEVVRG